VSAVRLAPACVEDAHAIAELEHCPENAPFIWARSAAEHRELMTDPDVRYLRIEDDAGTLIGEWGKGRVWLDIFEDNARARHIYESFGFRVTGYSHPPSRPRRDGATALLLRMEL